MIVYLNSSLEDLAQELVGCIGKCLIYLTESKIGFIKWMKISEDRAVEL